jgi:hypothetical protein
MAFRIFGLAMLVASIGTVLACAAQKGEPKDNTLAAASPGAAATELASPRDESRGYRARILVGAPGSRALDSWTDVAVLTASDWGRVACEALVNWEVSVLSASGSTARVARSCGTEPLAVPNASTARHLLVHPRVVHDTELELLVLEGPDDSKRDGDATVTDYSPFASKDDCERTVAEMAELRRRDRREAAEAARAFLEGQLLQQEEHAAEACERHQDVKERCASLGTDTDLERACRGSRESRRCREATERALERSGCEMERGHAERSCQAERMAVELLRQRVAAPHPADVAPASEPGCQRVE